LVNGFDSKKAWWSLAPNPGTILIKDSCCFPFWKRGAWKNSAHPIWNSLRLHQSIRSWYFEDSDFHICFVKPSFL